jgi:hypothetical protein
MRDINFRAWDNLEKRMRKVVSLYWQGGKLVSAKLEGENEPIPIEGRLVIEQSTGLKDRNGTEICEGDILMDDAGEPIEYWVIELSDGGLVGECAGVAEPLFELTNLEIAGNIHEDSELLEEK